MNHDTFTADELEAAQTAVDAEAAAESQARIKAKAAELRAEREKQQDRQAQAALVRATAERQAVDDVLIVGSTARGMLGDNVALLGSWLARSAFEALPGWWPVRCIGDLLPRALLVCREPHDDLRAMLAAGIADPLHDCIEHGGRARHDFECTGDAALVTRLFDSVAKSTTDRATLEGWLAAASSDEDAEVLRSRLERLGHHQGRSLMRGPEFTLAGHSLTKGI